AAEEVDDRGMLTGGGESLGLGDDGLRLERLLGRPFVRRHWDAHGITSSPPNQAATRRSRTRRSAGARTGTPARSCPATPPGASNRLPFLRGTTGRGAAARRRCRSSPR